MLYVLYSYCVFFFVFFFSFFFFFQAEDGIRDGTVIGVQTCALPIRSFPVPDGLQRAVNFWKQIFAQYSTNEVVLFDQIGRASCRERVYISRVAVSLKKKKIK